MKKKDVIDHLLTPPCFVNKGFVCSDCALKFTHLCEKDSKLHWLRRNRIKQIIEANTNGLDFISKERCQLTVLKEELNLIRNEPKHLKNDNDRDWSFHVPLDDSSFDKYIRSQFEQKAG